MLFPLADLDLYHFMRKGTHPSLTTEFTSWLVRQLGGIRDAIKYLHEYEQYPTNSQHTPAGQRRVGFHHDLKPANVLLNQEDPNRAVWKISDCGFGTVA